MFKTEKIIFDNFKLRRSEIKLAIPAEFIITGYPEKIVVISRGIKLQQVFKIGVLLFITDDLPVG